jgi:hypothetical protein
MRWAWLSALTSTLALAVGSLVSWSDPHGRHHSATWRAVVLLGGAAVVGAVVFIGRARSDREGSSPPLLLGLDRPDRHQVRTGIRAMSVSADPTLAGAQLEVALGETSAHPARDAFTFVPAIAVVTLVNHPGYWLAVVFVAVAIGATVVSAMRTRGWTAACRKYAAQFDPWSGRRLGSSKGQFSPGIDSRDA